MKRLLPYVLLLIIVTLTSQPSPQVSAQADKPKCDPNAVITQANGLKATNDPVADMKALRALASKISAASIACEGQTFEGKDDKIIGPVDIKQGLYRVRVTTKELLNVTFKAVEGQCGQGTTTTSFFEIRAGKSGGFLMAEGIINPQDCKFIIEAALTIGPWTLTIEPIE